MTSLSTSTVPNAIRPRGILNDVIAAHQPTEGCYRRGREVIFGYLSDDPMSLMVQA
jgi:hypothetical protein